MLKKFNFTIISLLLIIVGSFLWSLTMVKSGIVYDFGMGFWGPNGHDGVWHIALAESLSRGSWQMPVFAGEVIKNYHIGFDLILSLLNKITLIPVRILYFQILPPIFAVLIGLFSYLFVYYWKHSYRGAFWSTFFVYFGGSFGYIITFLRDGKIDGESLFWSQQAISTLVNPPFALSVLIIFAALVFLLEGYKDKVEKKANRKLIIAIFLMGVLVQIKVYAGILVLVALFFSGFWLFIKRKDILLIKVFISVLVISILFLTPVSKGVSKMITFRPFWFLEGMFATTDRFYLPKLAEAMLNYRLSGVFFKGFLVFGFSFFVFAVGNLGTRIIATFEIIRRTKKLKNLDFIEVFIYSVVFFGLLIPTFFIQTGTPWNTIQFMYYSLLFCGILAGVWFGDFVGGISKKGLLNFSLSLMLVGLTIPTSIGTLWNHYLPKRPPAMISKDELEALRFLRNLKEGVVITLPFDREASLKAISKPPRPLYLYESTAYVSAFSKKPTYLEDEVNLEITGYDWKKRRNDSEIFFATANREQAISFLKKNNIKYIYFVKDLLDDVSIQTVFLRKIYENSKVLIFIYDN